MIERSYKRRPRIEIINMIDVAFFLVIFFMTFSTLKITPAGININLPKAVTGTKQQAAKMIISVDRNGVRYIDGKAVSSEELKKQVRQATRLKPDIFIVIQGDRNALYDSIVKTMDDVRQVGAFRLGLAVEQTGKL